MKKATALRLPETKSIMRFRKARQEFFARFASLWPDALTDPYDLLAPLPLSRHEILAITEAAEAVVRLYTRTCPVIRALPRTALLQMGLPDSAVDLARIVIPGMEDSVVSRLDFVKGHDGYKLLDFNADVPGLLIETFSISSKSCEHYNARDPNHDAEAVLVSALQRSIRAGLEYVGKTRRKKATLVFTSHGNYVKDRAMARYLIELLDLPESIRKYYVPVEALCANSNGLHDGEGNRIDVLYHLYPLHLLQRKIDATSGGQVLTDLLRNHRLAIINPPSAYLLECKAVQAVIWGLYETDFHFTGEERALVAKHMLATYLDPIPDKNPYVMKPAFGREGDSVKIIARNHCVWSNGTSTYSNRAMVYQKFVESPEATLMTELGPQKLCLIASCFLLGGKPIGISIRAGRKIIDDSAWFVPVCVSR